MLVQEVMTRQKHRLLQEMNQVQTDLQIIGDRCMRRLDEGGDAVDQANHTVEADIDWTLRHLHQQELRRLEQALARSCEGQYGICESCGAQIDPARLNIMPYATLCISCQRGIERQRQPYYR
jgi:DnaK suppressor protein